MGVLPRGGGLGYEGGLGKLDLLGPREFGLQEPDEDQEPPGGLPGRVFPMAGGQAYKPAARSGA